MANWCVTQSAGSPVPISPPRGLGPFAMKSLPNSNGPCRKCTSVKPLAASSAIRGASNSRSVTVSRKPATTSRSMIFLPFAVDYLLEPPLLVRRKRVHLRANPLLVCGRDDHLEHRIAVLVEAHVHLLERGQEALGSVAMGVGYVPGS